MSWMTGSGGAGGGETTDDAAAAAIEEAEDTCLDDDPSNAPVLEKPYVVVTRAVSEAMAELGARPSFTDIAFGYRKLCRDAHHARMEAPPGPPDEPLTDRAFLETALVWANYANAIYRKSAEEFLEAVSVDAAAVVVADWKVSMLHPVHAIVYDAAHEAVVVAIRGTFSVSDALTDLAAAGEPFAGDIAHRGMSVAANWFIDNRLPEIQRALEEHPEATLVVTGHSLGAGSATLLTILLQEYVADERLRCWAFATPGCASPTLAESQRDHTVTFVNDLDCIPRLSLHASWWALRAFEECGWREEYAERYAAEKARLEGYLRESRTFQAIGRGASVASSALQSAFNGLSQTATAKAAGAAAESAMKATAGAAKAGADRLKGLDIGGRLGAVMGSGGGGDGPADVKPGDDAESVEAEEPATKMPDPMVPPGVIIQLTPVGDTVYAHEAPATDYMTLKAGKTVVSDHSMGLYKARIEKAIERLSEMPGGRI